MDVSDPLPVFLPRFDHCFCGLLALVVNPDRTVTESRSKNIAFYLV
jgi:hypothetical protein